jgi:hypothetical protein
MNSTVAFKRRRRCSSEVKPPANAAAPSACAHGTSSSPESCYWQGQRKGGLQVALEAAQPFRTTIERVSR